MTPEETANLLRYAATLDHWLGQTDEEAGALMVLGWSDMLGPVPKDAALDAVRRHYAEPGARTIQPGDILGAYRESLRARSAEEVLEQTAELNAAAPGPRQGMGLWMRDVLAAVRAGRPVESVPLPEGTSVTPAQDAWQRRCAFPNICACSHTECRAGWLDVEATVVNALGRRYPAAKRCPVCADGILMAQERGIARKPRPHSGRLR